MNIQLTQMMDSSEEELTKEDAGYYLEQLDGLFSETSEKLK